MFYKDNFKTFQLFLFQETGESGSVDAGSIKLEFFTNVFDVVTTRLLEGDDEIGYLPKRLGMASRKNFEVLALVIYHAFVQGGVFFGRFQNWVFNYLIDPDDLDLLKCSVNVEHIPKNAGTAPLLEFIDDLKGAESDEDIFNLCGKPEYSERINASQWDICDPVNTENKNLLIQELIYDEVVRKRHEQLNALISGFRFCGFYDVMKKHRNIIDEVFVPCKSMSPFPLFKKAIQNLQYDNQQIIEWFDEYIESADDTTLKRLLQFTTARVTVPSYGLRKPIKVELLKDDENLIYPRSMTCFQIISLPVVHSKKENFFKHMNTALALESSGLSAEEAGDE